jgi:Domain of unknown function (DUF4440)/Domain of unknown function (DUF3471)
MKQLALIRFLSAATIVCAADVPITQDELVRRTQELYDAVVPGNQAPWKKYFADDCIFADEKGRIFDKPKLIADITPLPPGYSGTIKIENAQSRIIGNTAILSYDADETETIFGQNLKARYHVTDTWLQRNGNWQIIASQAHRYYEDPAVGKADPKRFPDYVGTYELAPGQTRSVIAEGDKLFVERNGKKEQLLPETSEIFFRKGVEGRILFRYAANGKVDALIDRRNNEDVIWRKMGKEEVRSLSSKVNGEIKECVFPVSHFLIETRSPPGLLAPTLVTLSSMSRAPRTPFILLTSHFPSAGRSSQTRPAP